MVPLFLVFSDWAILIFRIAVGLVLVVHGWPKIKDLKKTAENFQGMGLKPGMFWGTIAACVEFIGGSLLIAGFFTQFVAVFIVLEFVVIMIKRFQWKAKFVGGYEIDILILAGALLLIALGSGACSLDQFFGFQFLF